MFDFQGLGTKQVQLADIKLTANQIKLSQDVIDFLGHNNDANNIFIDKDRRTGAFWLASIPTTEDAPSPGKKLTKSDAFGSQGLHHAMGGQYSEWKVEKLENETCDGITYYKLSLTLDGAVKRAELEELSGIGKEDNSKDNVKEPDLKFDNPEEDISDDNAKISEKEAAEDEEDDAKEPEAIPEQESNTNF